MRGADLRLERVEVNYPQFTLGPISLKLSGGGFLCLLGPSGAGKSTLLGCIGGWVPTSSGKVYIGAEEQSATPIHMRPVRTCFQKGGFLFPHMTVAENVAYALKLKGAPRDERARISERVLGMVGLSGFGSRTITSLSGGEAQRVAIARAVADPQPILLFDEIEASLDRRLQSAVREHVMTVISETGLTSIYVSHNPTGALEMASRMGGVVAVINAGRIEQLGSPEDLYWKPQTKAAAELTGAVNFVPAGSQVAQSAEVDAVVYAVRPEWIHRAGSQASENTGEIFEACVARLGFVGDRLSVTLDLKGTIVEALWPIADDRPAIGEVVRVVIPRHRIVPLASERGS